MDKEGGFVNRPLVLTGSNYDYWKPHMVAFIKALDSKAWKAIVKGWKHPVVLDAIKQPTSTLKLEEDWDDEEDNLALGNFKALNAIFNSIDRNVFRLVNTCEVAKDAWDILKTAHEGTSKVKMSRLQLLTTQFENLRMKEDESIHDFYMNVFEIANTSSALGEKMPEEKLVRKMLRSLPKSFDMKVTAIEEAQDINLLKLDELVRSLQTFEMSVNERSEKENKSIAFVANSKDGQEECNLSTKEGTVNSIVLLGRQINLVTKQMKRNPNSNAQNNSFDILKANDLEIRRGEEKYPQEKEKFVKHVEALTGRWGSSEESSDDELTYDGLGASYRELYLRSSDLGQMTDRQKDLIHHLKAEKREHLKTISALKEEVLSLKSELDRVHKSVRMLNKGNDSLDEILEMGRITGDLSGLGFSKNKISASDTSYPKYGSEMLVQMSQYYGKSRVVPVTARFY
ncbi:uncharacterized protein LOC131641069 [Vicia villosa]|uniref:uncharacterized protein LOC131641069 n=1 Tax=Vicia villosa TaxID=3911 RepID=UPI00273C4F26|nr:uncharacterized protein LOC131641069 [Vicia villosa]